MSTIEIRVTEAVTVANFAESVANGNVQFYTVRGNGTTRHIPVFAEGTEGFQVGEQVAEWREDGRTMKSIAAELHLSVPSVRRMLNSFYLSDEVAGYESEDIEELLAEAGEVADSNEKTEWVIGMITGPAEDASDHHCTHCGDALETGNICNECFAKFVTNA